MTNRLTDIAREEFLSGDRDWSTGTYLLALMAADHVDSPAHVVWSDVSADAIDTWALTSRTTTDGVADAADLSLDGLTPGVDYAGLWVYCSDDDRLICWLDTQGNETPIAGTTNSLPIAVTWPSLGVFKL